MNNEKLSVFWNNVLAFMINGAIRKGYIYCINAISFDDPDIDFKIVVSKRNLEKACCAIDEASRRYYDDEDPMYYYNGWGDIVKEELKKAGINHYAIFYASTKYEISYFPYNELKASDSKWF